MTKNYVLQNYRLQFVKIFFTFLILLGLTYTAAAFLLWQLSAQGDVMRAVHTELAAQCQGAEYFNTQLVIKYELMDL